MKIAVNQFSFKSNTYKHNKNQINPAFCAKGVSPAVINNKKQVISLNKITKDTKKNILDYLKGLKEELFQLEGENKKINFSMTDQETITNDGFKRRVTYNPTNKQLYVIENSPEGLASRSALINEDESVEMFISTKSQIVDEIGATTKSNEENKIKGNEIISYFAQNENPYRIRKHVGFNFYDITANAKGKIVTAARIPDGRAEVLI